MGQYSPQGGSCSSGEADSRTASADSIDAVHAEATASSIMEMPRISVADSLLSDSAAVASVGYIPGGNHTDYYFVLRYSTIPHA